MKPQANPIGKYNPNLLNRIKEQLYKEKNFINLPGFKEGIDKIKDYDDLRIFFDEFYGEDMGTLINLIKDL